MGPEQIFDVEDTVQRSDGYLAGRAIPEREHRLNGTVAVVRNVSDRSQSVEPNAIRFDVLYTHARAHSVSAADALERNAVARAIRHCDRSA